jgi:hypothetical protein
MNITRILTLRAFLLITLLISFACLTYGTEGRPPVVHIVRNVAWNDFISQINFLPDDSPQDSFDKELLVVQKFLKAHETEVRVGVYDLEVFRAIDQARARLQKADRDLETVRKELSYKEAKQSLGGDLWNSGQPSFAASVSSQLSRDKATVMCASKFLAWRVTTSSIAGFEPETVGTIS